MFLSLSLKSSPSPSSPSLSSPINGLVPSHTVLTTHNQTFQLRQVQSSNSIFLLQPHVTSDPGTDDLNIVPDLSIVAECKATLELIPSSTSSVAWLKDLLPLYNGSQEEASFGAPQVTKAERRSKYDHLTNLPLSVDEFESGWREVCAFEIDGQALRPSVQCLVGAWKAVVSASTAQGIDLGRQFSITDILDILEADDYPRTLFEAVVWNLTLPESVSMGSVCLDKEKCICWVGATMLETLGQRTTPIGGFLEAWKNELPELWRTAATLDALKVISVCWTEHWKLLRPCIRAHIVSQHLRPSASMVLHLIQRCVNPLPLEPPMDPSRSRANGMKNSGLQGDRQAPYIFYSHYHPKDLKFGCCLKRSR